MTKNGALEYKGKNIQISDKFPFKIYALQNVTDGYEEDVSIQCTNGKQFSQNTESFKVNQTLSCTNAMSKHLQGEVSVKFDALQTTPKPIAGENIDFYYFFSNKDKVKCVAT